jgi:alpha-L-fucosidase
LTWEDSLEITIDSDSLNTVTPGTLKRLAPGQTAIVQVGVTNKDGVAPGTQCDGTAKASYSDGQSSNLGFSGSCGIGDFEATEDSLKSHQSPDWFQDVKYGIFIHWGLYSVPAYGNGPGPDQDYAEW